MENERVLINLTTGELTLVFCVGDGWKKIKCNGFERFTSGHEINLLKKFGVVEDLGEL